MFSEISLLTMRTLFLPDDVPLRPKSLALLREIGVKFSNHDGGSWLEFPAGVAQVVSCVLETEKPFVTNSEARMRIDRAIATLGEKSETPDQTSQPHGLRINV
jgi:hypothetical protein